MPQKLDRMQAVERFLTHQHIDASGECQPAHDRKMIVGLPYVQDRCLSDRSVGLYPAGQQVKPCFIHENNLTLLPARLQRQAGPDFVTPPLNLLLVSLNGPHERRLRTPTQLLQKPRDLASVVGDAELGFCDLFDPSARPDLATEPVGFGTMTEQVRDQSRLLRFQLGRPTGFRAGEQCCRTVASRPCDPLADGSLRYAKRDGNIALRPAQLQQMPGPHPPPFSQV